MRKTGNWIKSILFTLAVAGSILISANAEAARGRPVLNAGKSTFVSDTGTLLRGMICGSNPAAIPQTTNYGCNAVHLYAESAGGAAAGYNSNLVDSVVTMTRTNGMYLIITIGGGGVNLNFATNFWNFYAGRYANETHVLYEIQNESTAGAPASSSVINLMTNCYKIIRAKAPNSPVLLFSYVAFNSGSGVLQDVTNVSSVVNWSNAAVAFHGYGSGGPDGMDNCMKTVLAAGYPCFQTEFYRWPWGTGNFALGADASMYQDVTETAMLERRQVSWLTFITINNFTNDARFKLPLNNGGVTWTPDFGNWPVGGRSTYGNGGYPWWTTNLSGVAHIEAENYDTGGANVAYSDTGSGNSGGAYRTDNVDIETTTDTGGGYDIGWIVAGEWLEYTTYEDEGGYDNLKLRVASPQTNNQIDVTFYGANVTNDTGTISFPGTGAYQTWTTITNTIFLPPGQQRMRVNMVTSGFNLNWLELSAVTTGQLTNGIYTAINQNSGLAMEVVGAATTNGASIDQWTYSGASNQKWTLTHRGGGQYSMACVQTGKGIDEESYNALCGAFIDVYDLNNGVGSLNQRWIPVPIGSGYYKLLSANSGLLLDVAGGSTAQGALIDQWIDKNGANQHWLIQAP